MKLSNAALAVLVVLVGLAHAASLSTRLPHGTAKDEHVYIWHLALFDAPPEVRLKSPFYGFYPHLVSRLASLVPEREPAAADEVEAELDAASSDYVRVRLVVGLLALLVVPATWSVARRLAGPDAAWLASALAGTSLLFAWYACEARPHAAFGGLAWVALAAALAARRSGGARAFLLAGVASGLAIATLQTGAFLLPALAAAHFLRPADARRGELRWLAAALAAAALVALPFYPFLFAHPDPIGIGTPQGATNILSHDVWLDAFDGGGFAALLYALWDYEPVLLALSLTGVLAAVFPERKRVDGVDRESGGRARPSRADLGVVLAFVAPYAILFGLYRGTFARFSIPLLPAFAIAAAWGTCALAERAAAEIGRPDQAPRVRAAAGALVLALALGPFAKLTSLRHRPDTVQEAAAWIRSHVARESETIAVLPSIDLPLVYTESPAPRPSPGQPAGSQIGSRNSPWRMHQAALTPELRSRAGWRIRELHLTDDDQRQAVLTDPARFVAGLDARWIVLEIWDRPVLRELVAWLRQNAELALRLAPSDEPGDDRPFLVDENTGEYARGASWAARMLGLRRQGNVIEIYRVR